MTRPGLKCDTCGDEPSGDVEAGQRCGRDLSEELDRLERTCFCSGTYREGVHPDFHPLAVHVVLLTPEQLAEDWNVDVPRRVLVDEDGNPHRASRAYVINNLPVCLVDLGHVRNEIPLRRLRRTS